MTGEYNDTDGHMEEFRAASRRGLEETITDMEIRSNQSDDSRLYKSNKSAASLPNTGNTEMIYHAGEGEIMSKLEGLEAEIMTSIQDIDEEYIGAEGGVCFKSHDHCSGSASVRHSHDHAQTKSVNSGPSQSTVAVSLAPELPLAASALKNTSKSEVKPVQQETEIYRRKQKIK